MKFVGKKYRFRIVNLKQFSSLKFRTKHMKLSINKLQFLIKKILIQHEGITLGRWVMLE